MSGKATKKELMDVLEGVLPGHLDEKQRVKKLSILLQKMKASKIADVSGMGVASKWYLVKNNGLNLFDNIF